jgi:hypothetical protein
MTEPTIEDRVKLLEDRTFRIAKALVRLAKILKSQHSEEVQDEGGFKDDTPTDEDQRDVSDQQDFWEEFEEDTE